MSTVSKICTKCKRELPGTLEFFCKRTRRGRIGLNTRCKDCCNAENREYKKVYKQSGKESQYSQAYYEKNKERIKEQKLKYYQENSETCRARAIQTRLKNIVRYREYNRVYQNSHRIDRAIRSGFWNCLFGRQKQSRSFQYVGLTPKEFRSYLESKFVDGMTWENYGNPNGDHTDCWHIDHIIPLSSFKLDTLNGEELENALHKAWHYSNLQPLWGKENISKGARY